MTNPLLRKAQPLEDAPNPYEGLGLRENPFPYEPSLVIGSENPRLNGAIYSPELHRDGEAEFDQLLVPAPDRPNPRAISFLMDYATRRGRGIGKTAFLKHQRDRVMEDFGEQASRGGAVLFATHVIPTASPPCRKFWEFCRAVSLSLCETVIPQAVWRLRALSGAIPDEVLEEIAESEDWATTIGNDHWLEQKGISSFFHLNREVTAKIQGAGVGEELANRLASECLTADRARETLSRITDVQWRKDGGRLLFNDLVGFFWAAAFTRGLLLVDEVEKIVYHQNAQERRAFAESIRYFMLDGECLNARKRFFGMLLTIHPGVQEILLPHWNSAGLDRLAPLGGPEAKQSTLYLGPLDGPMAVPLVKVYLDYYRTSDSERGRLAPFKREAVIEALLKSGGVPGRTLNLLHRVVEEAAEEGIQTIGEELVRRVYESHGPQEAEELDEHEMPPRAQIDLTGNGGG